MGGRQRTTLLEIGVKKEEKRLKKTGKGPSKRKRKK